MTTSRKIEILRAEAQQILNNAELTSRQKETELGRISQQARDLRTDAHRERDQDGQTAARLLVEQIGSWIINLPIQRGV